MSSGQRNAAQHHTAQHHAEWLSLVEISGPFLSMPVLLRAFPHGLDADDPAQTQELRAAYEEWLDNQQGLRAEEAIHTAWIEYVLSAGGRVPADGRVVEGVRLQIQEAALTGESLPVSKVADSLIAEDGEIPLGDRLNMAYMGTVITDGRGLMMVTATGVGTEVGRMVP